jgi:glycerophosphoryl diester phosphodiesterase
VSSHPYLALPGPWLVAHRGGSLLAPENTFAAFDRADALGADALEIDVRRTADGVVVVFHDDDTARITGAPGTIEARTFAELSRLDAGFGFTPDGVAFPYRGAGVRVPSLAEVLRRYPRVRVSIDAKPDDAGLAEALAAVIREEGAEERVCVGSFFDAQSARLGALLPRAARYLPEQAATCHVMAARSGEDRPPMPGRDGAGCPGGFQLASLPQRMGELEVVDATTIAYFHARGMAVHAWTVNEEADMRHLLALGVDGIITDRPDVLARVLGRAR